MQAGGPIDLPTKARDAARVLRRWNGADDSVAGAMSLPAKAHQAKISPNEVVIGAKSVESRGDLRDYLERFL